jgi:hypothetical protein
VRLAALDRQDRFLGANIAGHQLEPGAEHVVEHERPGIGFRACSGAGDDHLLFPDVVDRLERRRPPRHADADILGGRANPRERAHVVAGSAGADQRLENRSSGEGRHRGAIAWRLLGEVVRRADAAGARHHLHGHGRLARDMAADVAGHQARIEIDAAAGGARDIDRHRTVDGVLRVAGLRRGRNQRHRTCQDRRTQPHELVRSLWADAVQGIGISPTSFGTL